jgi:hypothetical protein
VAINWTKTLFAPIYKTLGVPITFILVNTSVIEVLGLDKTGGVEVSEGISLQTIRPAAVLRMADLAAIDVAPDELMDAVCSINGESWKVKSYYPRPSPGGEGDGELYLILSEA